MTSAWAAMPVRKHVRHIAVMILISEWTRRRQRIFPFNQAFPFTYVIDDSACAKDCMKACFDACKYDAIDLNMKTETVSLKVGAIVMATGWNLYDATRMDNLGLWKSPECDHEHDDGEAGCGERAYGRQNRPSV